LISHAPVSDMRLFSAVVCLVLFAGPARAEDQEPPQQQQQQQIPPPVQALMQLREQALERESLVTQQLFVMRSEVERLKATAPSKKQIDSLNEQIARLNMELKSKTDEFNEQVKTSDTLRGYMEDWQKKFVDKDAEAKDLASSCPPPARRPE